jgi:hypothetical protein
VHLARSFAGKGRCTQLGGHLAGSIVEIHVSKDALTRAVSKAKDEGESVLPLGRARTQRRCLEGQDTADRGTGLYAQTPRWARVVPRRHE